MRYSFCLYSKKSSVLKNYSVVVTVSVILLLGVTNLEPVSAQKYDSLLTLDSLPSKISEGKSVIFSGKIVTGSGYPISGAVVQIKDDVSFGRDKVIRTATTDKDGKFYVSWKATSRSSGSYDLYAVYGGSDQIGKSRSFSYTVSVGPSHVQDSSSDYNAKYLVSTRITLDRIPSSVYAGDTVTFTGKVTSNGYAVSGAVVQIKDDVSYGRDKVIRTVTTDKYGKFYVSWKAIQKNSGSYNLYAVYGGNDSFDKSRSLPYTVSVSSSHVQDSSSDYNTKTDPVSTRITLDRIPSSVYAGDTVTFTGKVTSNGYAVSGATVHIKEDDPGPDQRLTMVRTDSNGKFKSVWKVTAGLFEKDFDVYAVFEGNSSYKRDRSYNQTMTVLKHGGSIVLDSFPSSAKIGDMITFSGKLQFTNKETQGAIVYIKDEDLFNSDDLLATAYVDSSGMFSADWRVTKVDRDNIVDIYAVFEGSGIFYRITTCDKGHTSTLGGICAYTIPLKISNEAAITTPTKDPVLPGEQYMKLYYSHSFRTDPLVTIVPTPDSYRDVQSHIIPVQEGVRMWEYELEQKYGGDWNVNFQVVRPDAMFFESKPDIIINLVTRNEDSKCGKDYAGYALTNPKKPVNTAVCSTDSKSKRSNENVSRTAAHEFIHAMGLGHAFNKEGDMMCSIERGVPTCPNVYQRSKTPSELNYAAVVELYGTDGYKNPNSYVTRDTKFTLNDSVDNNTTLPIPDTESTTPTTPNNDSYCDGIDYKYDYIIDDLRLDSEWYQLYPICSSRELNYSFSTNDSQDGFLIYVLTPETNVDDFINDGAGRYYTCEEYGQRWHKKSNTCNIEYGSKIVLYNTQKNTIEITGWIKN